MPQVHQEPAVDIGMVREFLSIADDRYDSVWVQERMLGRGQCLDPLISLGFAAGLTDRVRLGTAVLLSTFRNPVRLAKALASIDQFSGGRLIVGLAAGEKSPLEAAFRYPTENRRRLFREGLDLMKRLWTEEEVDSFTEDWALHRARMQPKPVQRPRPPVWFGATSANGLERTVELADGYIGAGVATTQEFAASVEMLRGFLRTAGGRPGFPISKRVFVAVEDTPTTAQSRLDEWGAWYYGVDDFSARGVFGTVDDCCEGISRVLDAGADMVILHPVYDYIRHAEVLADKVVPMVDHEP
jgi:alkanesulfonate monooxygenase SsuD/methylene tetrahydromethanopterin reductase-like flavin-dependent oxidoreductase (luciferase family)